MAKAEEKVSRYTLGRRIAELREEANLTQAQLAKAAGISSGASSNYETCKSYPQPKALAGIARALGTTPEALEAPETAAEIAAREAHEQEEKEQADAPKAAARGVLSSVFAKQTQTQGRETGGVLYTLEVPQTLADEFDRVAAAHGYASVDILRSLMREYVQGKANPRWISNCYTLDELAAMWGVSRRALDDYRRAGRLETFKIGATWYVTPDAVNAFISRGGMTGGIPRRKGDHDS